VILEGAVSQHLRGHAPMSADGDKLPDGENRSRFGVGQFSAIHETFQGRAGAVRNFEFEASALR